jgi:hypothetical protein
MIQEFNETFILLDALDECKELQELLIGIQEILKGNTQRLHILVTSRAEKDIKEWFDPLTTGQKTSVSLESALVKDDIRIYIHERLQTDLKMERWPNMPEVREEIETKLMDKADGMRRCLEKRTR